MSNKFIKPDPGDWLLGIKKVANGFIVQTSDDTDEEGNVKIQEFVFEESEDKEGSEYYSICEMFHAIMDFFGVHYSDHNPYNLIVKIEKRGKRNE